MHITWLGQNCFKIEGKNATVVIDPVFGSGLRLSAADVVVLPHEVTEKERGSLEGKTFVIDTPGEFEVKGVFVEGQAVGSSTSTIYRVEVDGVRFGHLNTLARSDEAIEAFLEDVDVLFVPVGGGEALSPAAAVEVVSKIEPRLVIPMHFRDADNAKLEPVEKFCQAMGVKSPDRQKKLSLQKKDLPNEETRLIILEA